MKIFEEKIPVDLLDDDRDERDERITMDKNLSNQQSVLPFTISSTLSHGSPVISNYTPVPNYPNNPEQVSPFPSLKNLSKKPIVPKPTPVKAHTRAKSIDKVVQLFTGQREEENEVDLSIGLRLALPDKLDIMTGTTPIKEDNSEDTPSKKLMIVREGPLRFSKSPFKRRPIAKCSSSESKSVMKEAIVEEVEEKAPESEADKKEILLRTSELEPSVHQVSIPEATDLLVHARVCSLMEGYDQLLEIRAKAGKRWFSFGHLVGLSRKDLENMYLIAIGKSPAIPMYIGKEAENLPPPLPNIIQSSFVAPRLGNPF